VIDFSRAALRNKVKRARGTRETIRTHSDVMKKVVAAFALAAFSVSIVALADPPMPPQEAFDVCANSKDGDACTVHFGSEAVQGTCAKFPGKDVLACRPNNPPPRPPPNQ
jgi:hypothetical protein